MHIEIHAVEAACFLSACDKYAVWAAEYDTTHVHTESGRHLPFLTLGLFHKCALMTAEYDTIHVRTHYKNNISRLHLVPQKSAERTSASLPELGEPWDREGIPKRGQPASDHLCSPVALPVRLLGSHQAVTGAVRRSHVVIANACTLRRIATKVRLC